MKVFTGIVTSTQNAKTARVAVERVMAHPVYRKRVRRTKNYLVHDEMGAEVGQRVQFVACKPYSKMKKWKIVEIVGKNGTKKSKVANKTKKEALKVEVVKEVAGKSKTVKKADAKKTIVKKTAAKVKKG